MSPNGQAECRFMLLPGRSDKRRVELEIDRPIYGMSPGCGLESAGHMLAVTLSELELGGVAARTSLPGKAGAVIGAALNLLKLAFCIEPDVEVARFVGTRLAHNRSIGIGLPGESGCVKRLVREDHVESFIDL